MTDNLWCSDEIVNATQGSLSGAAFTVDGIAMDSRDVQSGDLFIAMVGAQADGHDYAQKAKDNGATAILAMRQTDVDIPHIIVGDTFQALQDLGQAARDRAPLRHVIAITGSVGKTSTRNMMEAAFKAAGFKTHASIKSYNNHVGVPYSLATMPRGSEIGIFEVGMNHAGEITPLSLQVKPDIAVITWIAGVHIENFADGIHGIVKAKSEIFDGLQDGGVAILPLDNDYYDDLADNCDQDVISFGFDHKADGRILQCDLHADHSAIQAVITGEDVSLSLPLAGRHMAGNALIALMALKRSGGDLSKAVKGLEGLQPLAGRGRRFQVGLSQGGDIDVIDEAYNASPVAVTAALGVLGMATPRENGRRIAILGDMLELGAYAKAGHESLSAPLMAAQVDKLYCCGPMMKALYDVVPQAMQGGHYTDSTALAAVLRDIVRPHDIVLVKGSLGSQMKVIIDALETL